MATYNTINELFKDICDSLREKLEITGEIRHDEIAIKIKSIQTGTNLENANEEVY